MKHKYLKQDILTVWITINCLIILFLSLAAYNRYKWLNTTVENYCYVEQSEYDRIMGIEKEDAGEVKEPIETITYTHYDEVTVDGIMYLKGEN